MKTMIVILSAFVLLTQAVGADHPGRWLGREPGRGPVNGWMMVHREGPYSAAWIAEAGLRLTEAQADRIRTLEEKWARQIEPLRARLVDTGKELKVEWLKPEPDRRRIEVLQAEVSRLHESMREKLAGRRAEALEVLTPAQQARLEEAEQRRDLHHDRIRFRLNRERR
jgi:Spy/CpxP family protein refolding chaperone